MDLRVVALVHRLPKNNVDEVTAMLARIQAYEACLSEDPAAVFPPCCPACQEPGCLRKHEFRRRGFWFRMGNEVKRVASFVLRVACTRCGKPSTVLPGFARPHGRYVLGDVVDASDRYLLDGTATYESAARHGGRPVFHDADGACLARSTVHRWVGFLGSLVALLGHATGVLRDADPAFSPAAEMIPISPRRYRTEARRELLGRAQQLLRVRSRLWRAMGCEPFPRIATAAAWS